LPSRILLSTAMLLAALTIVPDQASARGGGGHGGGGGSHHGSGGGAHSGAKPHAGGGVIVGAHGGSGKVLVGRRRSAKMIAIGPGGKIVVARASAGTSALPPPLSGTIVPSFGNSSFERQGSFIVEHTPVGVEIVRPAVPSNRFRGE
jgi:hypothetical protein